MNKNTCKYLACLLAALLVCSTFSPIVTGLAETVGDESITFPLAEKKTLDVFVYASNTGGGTMQDNYVTDWIEEKTNIHLNFVYDVDGDEAKTKLNLLMTDPESLPDVFWTTFWTKSELMLYAEQGLILPLDEYLDKAPNWNASNEIIPGRRDDLTMKDGHIYTFGSAAESFHNTYQNRMWIYMPWVNELNDGHIPETTDEMYEYLTKVKAAYPNSVPVTGYLGGWSTDPTVWFINSFVQCNNPLSNTNPTVGAGFSVNREGKLEYAPMKEEYREAMRYLAKLYKEGLLDPQLFTQDSTQFAATLNNDPNLVAMHAAGRNQADKAHFDAGEDGTWSNWYCIEPLQGPEGIGVVAGKKEYIEKIRKMHYSGGCQTQGHEAMDVLRGLVYAPVSLAIQAKTGEEILQRLKNKEVPGIKDATIANAQSKVLIVELETPNAREVLKQAEKLGALPNPVGAESKYEIAPLFYKVSGTFLAKDPTLIDRMIRINPNRAGADTVIEVLRKSIERSA